MTYCLLNHEIRTNFNDTQYVKSMEKIYTFEPPKEALYTLIPFDIMKSNNNPHYQRSIFTHSFYSNISYPWLNIYGYYIIKRKSYDKLAMIHLQYKKPPKDNHYTILFCHGNGVTIGSIYPFLIDLCLNTKCDIVAFDYSGYGKSDGKPSEIFINGDIEEIAYCLKDLLGISNHNLILMGFSLGTIPLIYLASLKYSYDIAGMILISPIATDISSVNNREILVNIKQINNIKCPVFLIHGHQDNIIPLTHSIELSKHITNVYKWYPKTGDHKNIVTEFRLKFYQKCKRFKEYLSRLTQYDYSNKQYIKSYNLLNDSNIIKYDSFSMAQREEKFTNNSNTSNSNNHDEIKEHSEVSKDIKPYQKSDIVCIKNFDHYEIPECTIDLENEDKENDYTNNEEWLSSD